MISIDVPIFGRHIDLYIGGEREAAEERVLLALEAEISSEFDCFHCYINNNMSVIYINSYENTPKYIGYLSHEILHCAVSILTDLSIPFDETNEEILTYLHQYILEEFLSKLMNGKS